MRSRVLCTPLCTSPSHVLPWPRGPLAQALLVLSAAPATPHALTGGHHRRTGEAAQAVDAW
jgi:hypothetical protein